MPPPISLEGSTPTSGGNEVNGQGNKLFKLPDPDTVRGRSARSGVLDPSVKMRFEAQLTDFSIQMVTSKLSQITTHKCDESELANIMGELKKIENSFETGYGDNSIGFVEEDLTDEQVEARVDLACAAGTIGDAERLIERYKPEMNPEETKQDTSDDDNEEWKSARGG